MAVQLSERDVRRLLEEPTVENKTRTLGHISSLLDQEDAALGPRERALAEDILRVLSRDTEVRVREAVAAQLCSNPNLPRDVALSLAGDLDSIALPVIEFSSVLAEGDILDLVSKSGDGKLRAIARRTYLSEIIVESLIETRNERVVATVMENASADVSERCLSKTLEQFPASETVHEPMVRRAALPVAISERLVAMVSERLQTHLATHHGLSCDLAADIVHRARERATVDLVSNDQDAIDLVGELHQNGRLTVSIIVRALCVGDLAFFEAALARRAQIPLINARVLIHDSGRLGLDALGRRAGLPENVLGFVGAAIELMAEVDYDGRSGDRNRYKRRIVERLLTRFEHEGGEDIDYFLARVGGFASAAEDAGDEAAATNG